MTACQYSRPVQTFEKGAVNLRNFTKWGANQENSDFDAKLRDVNSVSGEKLHDFEIICPARRAWILSNGDSLYALFCRYALVLMPQVFNSHVLTDRNPFINKAIHVLLIHGFATSLTLVSGRHAKHVLSLQINTTNHENLTTAQIKHL